MSSLLSLTGRHWVLRRESADDIVNLLAQERGLADVVTGRQLKLSDPQKFPHAEKAVRRIRSAMETGETIGVFGDYDADGITGVAQLARFFRRHGVQAVIHLPHRLSEGYGLRCSSIDALHAKGVRVLLTVDTGIAATAELEHAAKLGMDVIVTDHHHAPAGMPPAYAVLHPLLPEPFPNPHLSGSGVALMLVRALEDGKPWVGMEQDIVLAAIGTIGDLVPLTGENRSLVIHALRLLQKLPDCPLKDFAEHVRGQSAQALTSTDIAFRIVPRINASGRIDHPDVALQALLDGGEALEKLHVLNERRQGMTGAMVERAIAQADVRQPFLCVASEEFHSGVVGLIAGALCERFGRPVLAASVTENVCTASLRSVPAVHVADMLHTEDIRKLLRTFGGHAQAAGCTFERSQFDALQAALNARMHALGHTPDSLRPALHLDGELSPASVSLSFVDMLKQLEPFGMGNDQPMFLLRAQQLDLVRTVGSDGKHVQCRVGGKKAVGFGLGTYAEAIKSQQCWDVACTVGVNEWNGRKEVQLMIKDMRPIRPEKQ